jgi:thioesterase domain-containing protein
MARVLLEKGEQIGCLILLDSLSPAVRQELTDGDEEMELIRGLYTTLARLFPDAKLKSDVEALRGTTSKRRGELIAAELGRHGLDVDAGQLTALIEVFVANDACYLAYRPAPLPREIDVSLYRACEKGGDWLPVPEDYGWNRLLRRPVRVNDVDGSHISMLDKDHVQAIARHIHTQIERFA